MHLKEVTQCYTRVIEYKTFVLILFLASIISFISFNDQSWAFSLNGLLAVDYNSTDTTTKTLNTETKSGTSNILQRYELFGSGSLITPRLASYSANIGFTESKYSSKLPSAGYSKDSRRDTLTYSLQMSLIPTITPTNIYIQKNIIGTEATGDLISTSYTLGWSTTLRTRTSIRTSLIQIGSEYDDPINPRSTRIRIATIGVNQNLTDSFIAANYQYTDSLVTDKKSDQDKGSNLQSYSIRGESKLTPTLFVSGNATYFPQGSVSSPGITVASETIGELGLLHQTEARFTESVNYTFRKSESGETKRDAVSYNMNYNPLGKTDYRTDVLYSSTRAIQNDTGEYRFAGGINHRPFYGFGISTSIVINHLGVTGTTDSRTDSRTDRVGAMAGLNYFKLLDMFNLNTNYSADASYVFSDQRKADGGIVTQSASAGLASRNLETTQILTSYTFLLRNNYIIKGEKRQEQSVHLEVRNNYIKKLPIQAAANYSNVLQYGNTFVFETRVEYNLSASTGVAAGYKLSDLPDAIISQDSQMYLVEAIHQRYLTRRLGMNLRVHGEREELQFIQRDKIALAAVFNYMIGKITINFEIREDYTKYPESVYNTQSYFVKASRPF